MDKGKKMKEKKDTRVRKNIYSLQKEDTQPMDSSKRKDTLL